jgi:hypothetical protein
MKPAHAAIMGLLGATCLAFANAAAVAAAAAAAPPTAGTVVYAPEPGCSTVERNGAYYRYCGGVYYQEHFAGDRVAFQVVRP